jgi:hypothetical protein
LTKIRLTGFENITPRIKSKINRAIAESGFAEELRKSITQEARDGGIKPDLSPSTIKSRKYLSAFNETHPSYQADKSNLTLTGQLLDSLRGKYVATKLRFNINPLKKKHKKYSTGGKSKSKAASIAQIFEWQADLGRSLSQVFTRPDFVKSISEKLRTAILSRYRN